MSKRKVLYHKLLFARLERFIDDLVKLLTNTTNLLRRYQQASVLTTADMYLKLKASDDYQQSCVKARMLCTVRQSFAILIGLNEGSNIDRQISTLSSIATINPCLINCQM